MAGAGTWCGIRDHGNLSGRLESGMVAPNISRYYRPSDATQTAVALVLTAISRRFTPTFSVPRHAA
jgi:hypothetical protein